MTSNYERMIKMKGETIVNKIILSIMTNHINEINDDMNGIINSYIKDIFQKITLKYGNNVTDEIIKAEVDEYFDTMYDPDEEDFIDESSDGIEIPHIVVQAGSVKIPEPNDNIYQKIRDSLFESLASLDVDNDYRKKMESSICELLSYTTYHMLLVNEMWKYIESKLENDEEKKKAADLIFGNLNERMTEVNELMNTMSEEDLMKEDFDDNDENDIDNDKVTDW